MNKTKTGINLSDKELGYLNIILSKYRPDYLDSMLNESDYIECKNIYNSIVSYGNPISKSIKMEKSIKLRKDSFSDAELDNIVSEFLRQKTNGVLINSNTYKSEFGKFFVLIYSSSVGEEIFRIREQKEFRSVELSDLQRKVSSLTSKDRIIGIYFESDNYSRTLVLEMKFKHGNYLYFTGDYVPEIFPYKFIVKSCVEYDYD